MFRSRTQQRERQEHKERAARNDLLKLMLLGEDVDDDSKFLHEQEQFRESVQQRFLEIIQTYPQLASEQWGRHARHPLHQATRFSSSLSIVEAVFEAYPQAIMEKGYHGTSKTPLHFACGNSSPSSEQVIRFLVNKYPQALKEEDEDSRTPLHCACYNGLSEQAIRFLINEYPEAVMNKDNLGDTPLDVAQKKNASTCVIELLSNTEQVLQAEEREHAARNEFVELMLLFNASEFQKKQERFQEIIQTYPELAKEKRWDGRLPLHVAAAYCSSPSIVEAVFDIYPQAVEEKTSYGCLPLHFAFGHDHQSEQVIWLLVNKYPEALTEKDFKGQTPLHCALIFGQLKQEQVIALLVDTYPQAVKEQDRDGKTPLDYAGEYSAPSCVIDLLSNACAEQLLQAQEFEIASQREQEVAAKRQCDQELLAEHHHQQQQQQQMQMQHGVEAKAQKRMLAQVKEIADLVNSQDYDTIAHVKEMVELLSGEDCAQVKTMLAQLQQSDIFASVQG